MTRWTRQDALLGHSGQSSRRATSSAGPRRTGTRATSWPRRGGAVPPGEHPGSVALDGEPLDLVACSPFSDVSRETELGGASPPGPSSSDLPAGSGGRGCTASGPRSGISWREQPGSGSQAARSGAQVQGTGANAGAGGRGQGRGGRSRPQPGVAVEARRGSRETDGPAMDDAGGCWLDRPHRRASAAGDHVPAGGWGPPGADPGRVEVGRRPMQCHAPGRGAGGLGSSTGCGGIGGQPPPDLQQAQNRGRRAGTPGRRG